MRTHVLTSPSTEPPSTKKQTSLQKKNYEPDAKRSACVTQPRQALLPDDIVSTSHTSPPLNTPLFSVRNSPQWWRRGSGWCSLTRWPRGYRESGWVERDRRTHWLSNYSYFKTNSETLPVACLSAMQYGWALDRLLREIVFADPDLGYVYLLKTCSGPRRAVRSHSLVCSKNYLLIVRIGPILNKELELIFRSDRSDRTCFYT